MSNDPSAPESERVKSAFGEKNRLRLINSYFGEQPQADVTPAKAWVHVYRLLLWVDQTTGLGHCYESDKTQPGKRWYSRSLAFHDWVSASLGVKPDKLAENIDWLFLRAAEALAAEELHKSERTIARAKAQLQPYEGRDFPLPGQDPEMVGIVREVLGAYVSSEPDAEVWTVLVQRLRQYLALANKRKNLVGEGFEDVLAEVVKRTCRRDDMQVHTRKALHDLPGFNRARTGDKPNKVDVAIIRPTARTLVTAKWSVRADREKQFTTDFSDYLSAESDRTPFEYVFVTNEFDPARLMRACEQMTGNHPMFTHVVHISTDAIRATYGPLDAEKDEAASMQRVIKHIDDGRLVSLERWLNYLSSK